MTDKLWSSKKYHIKKQNHGKFSIEDGMIFAIPNKLTVSANRYHYSA